MFLVFYGCVVCFIINFKMLVFKYNYLVVTFLVAKIICSNSVFHGTACISFKLLLYYIFSIDCIIISHMDNYYLFLINYTFTCKKCNVFKSYILFIIYLFSVHVFICLTYNLNSI